MSFLGAVATQTSSPGFRHDINALRALAFLCVLFYHFRLPGFAGGFAGVDIFLVISGYLMASILDRRISQARVDLSGFFSRRISRLVAPLIFVVAWCMVMGWLLLTPAAFEALGLHSIGALTFTSNIIFWRESGYFDADNGAKMLLHTWSLSLEAQFYLSFPFIYLLAKKVWKGRFATLAIVGSFLLVSLGLSIVLSQSKPVPAFFLLPTRLWEFMAGVVVYEISRYSQTIKGRSVLQVAGFAFLLATAFLIDSSQVWPGWMAAIPVLGTSLVLVADRANGHLFRLRSVQVLGLISYSGYLWHWPIVVLLVIFNKIDSPIFVACGLIASVLIACVSWYWAERKFGGWLQAFSNHKRWLVSGAVIGLVLAIPSLSTSNGGFPGRFEPQTNAIFNSALERPANNFCVDANDQHCLMRWEQAMARQTVEDVGAIIIGDSHAGMLSQAVADSLNSERSRVITLAHPACPTIAGIQVFLDLSGRCAQSVSRLENVPDGLEDVPVIIANRYAFYLYGPNETERGNRPNYYLRTRAGAWSQSYVDEMLSSYEKSICNIAIDRTAYVVLPFPEFPLDVPTGIGAELALTGSFSDVALTLSDYEERNREVLQMIDRLEAQCGVHKINPIPGLCPGGRCTGTRDQRILFTDSNHLTASGLAQVKSRISQALRQTPGTRGGAI